MAGTKYGVGITDSLDGTDARAKIVSLYYGGNGGKSELANGTLCYTDFKKLSKYAGEGCCEPFLLHNTKQTVKLKFLFTESVRR